jgi:hypothetical protein
MTIKFGPGTMISGFQHPGNGTGGGGGGGGGSLTGPSTVNTDPFGGSGPSWSFNGTSNGASVSVDNYGLVVPNGTPWCVEGFFYQTDNNPFPRVFAIGQYPSTSIGISIEGGTIYYWLNNGVAGTSTAPAQNSWHHFAFSSDGTGTNLYLDGTYFTFNGGTIPDITGQTLWIGCEAGAIGQTDFGGYINSFRWTVGNQVYTGNFTVPTSALGLTQSSGSNINAITSGQVKLLTGGGNHGSNTAVQASGNSGSNAVHIDTSYTWAASVPVGATVVADGVGTFTITGVTTPNAQGNFSGNWFFDVSPNNSSFPGGTNLTFTW